MILCSGEFPIIDASRARRESGSAEPCHAGMSSHSNAGRTSRGKPPPMLGVRLVYMMWWTAFFASVMQSACS